MGFKRYLLKHIQITPT